MQNTSLAVETNFWKLAWLGDGWILVWLASGGSAGDEVPFPPSPLQHWTLLALFWAQALVHYWHLNPSDVFSGGEALQ